MRNLKKELTQPARILKAQVNALFFLLHSGMSLLIVWQVKQRNKLIGMKHIKG